MASSARERFLANIRAFELACDKDPVRAADEAGDFIRRGMTVASFNILESFFEDRLKELATHANSGSVHFLDMPEGMQRSSIIQTLAGANSRLRRSKLDIGELRAFSADIGRALSTVNTGLSLSPLSWTWTGSNLNSEDMHRMLNFFLVSEPWNSLRGLAARLGFPTDDSSGQSISLRKDLDELGRQRNAAAHSASHEVTTLTLRSIPERLLRIAAPADLILSSGAHLVRQGNNELLEGSKWDPAVTIKLRFVRERHKDFAEYREGATRARHVASDGPALLAAASARCEPHEALVQQGVAGEVRGWSVPSVG